MRVDLGCRLRRLRLDRGWSVYDVEAHTGVSRSTVSRAERAETELTMTVLIKLSWSYGSSLSRLLAEAEAKACADQ